jgi:hypothetical protein
MKFIKYAASLLFISFITGCGNGSSEDTPGKNENTTAVQTAGPVDTTPANTVTVNPQQVTNTSSVTTTSTTGLNPEHGKPGHRCDIAVGAPLDSQPATASTVNQQPNFSSVKAPVINTPPTTTTTPVINTSTSSTVANGLNPEHGKPGHRCDIAVGAPLNSKPTQAVTKSPATVKTSTPAINTSSSSTTPAVANGLNPEHGKPGHRCELAVGAPLDSKPVMTTGVESNTISTTTKASTPATVANGLNPEHGKPGHRCDIAVGAPLDSKPKQ